VFLLVWVAVSLCAELPYWLGVRGYMNLSVFKYNAVEKRATRHGGRAGLPRLVQLVLA
jgi:hypothetical protein